MLTSNLLLLSFCISAIAQSSSSSKSTNSNGQTILTGLSENPVPTGPYISYSSTRTLKTASSPISTSIIVSAITSGSLTRTTTLGSTTIFGYSTETVGSNSTSSSTSSQLLLHGSGRSSSTAINGTAISARNSTTSSAPQATNTTPCNNFPEFCERKYGNITEVAAHNSPFVRTGNAAANQALDVTTQLNDGIRLLQAQIQFINGSGDTGEPHFCHTSCDVLDAGPITEYLGKVYNWVTAHPYDIVTILLGNGRLSNDTYPVVESYAPYIEQTGLVEYAYIPPKVPMGIADWPTLASMILKGKRVVIFMDYNANQTSVPWILDEFSQMWETPFDPTNRSFPCDVQRPPNQSPADTANKLYMTNHNLNYDINILGNSLLVPNIPLLNITNNVTGVGSLGVGAETCVEMWNYPPKFLNVDYYNVGNGSVFEVAAKYNNVTYNRSCCGKVTSGASNLGFWRRSTLWASFAALAVSWMLLT